MTAWNSTACLGCIPEESDNRAGNYIDYIDWKFVSRDAPPWLNAPPAEACAVQTECQPTTIFSLLTQELCFKTCYTTVIGYK